MLINMTEKENIGYSTKYIMIPWFLVIHFRIVPTTKDGYDIILNGFGSFAVISERNSLGEGLLPYFVVSK